MVAVRPVYAVASLSASRVQLTGIDYLSIECRVHDIVVSSVPENINSGLLEPLFLFVFNLCGLVLNWTVSQL